MILQWFLHADVFEVNFNVVCQLYLHVCFQQQLDEFGTKLLVTCSVSCMFFWMRMDERSVWYENVVNSNSLNSLNRLG